MIVQQLLQQLLAYISVLLGQVGSLYQSIVASNITVVIHDTAAETSQTLATVTSPTFGLATLEGQIVSMQAQLTTLLTDVVALGTPQQSGSPVTLPTTPPAGYGGATASATASAVWSATFPGHSQIASFYLINAGLFAVNLGTTAMRVNLADQMRWQVLGPWVDDSGPDLPNRDVPNLDPNTIEPGDANIADWINRVQPGYGATLTAEGWATIPDGGAYVYLYDMSPWEFLQIRANNPPASWSGLSAPVWPGIANVTLGSPHTMVPPGENIAVDCDGVIIAVTGTPPWAGNFSFGSAISWRNVGAVTFTTDDGEQEFAQTFSWSSGIYLSKSQTRAAGYAYRAAVGVSGTITPFTINS